MVYYINCKNHLVRFICFSPNYQFHKRLPIVMVMVRPTMVHVSCYNNNSPNQHFLNLSLWIVWDCPFGDAIWKGSSIGYLSIPVEPKWNQVRPNQLLASTTGQNSPSLVVKLHRGRENRLSSIQSFRSMMKEQSQSTNQREITNLRGGKSRTPSFRTSLSLLSNKIDEDKIRPGPNPKPGPASDPKPDPKPPDQLF